MFSISFTGDLFTIFIRDNTIFKIILCSFYVFNDKAMFLNQFLAVLDDVHNTRIKTPIVQLQSSKSAWFIRIKSHGLDLEKADFKNFLWFVRSIWKGTVYRSADSTETRRAHLYKHTLQLIVYYIISNITLCSMHVSILWLCIFCSKHRLINSISL